MFRLALALSVLGLAAGSSLAAQTGEYGARARLEHPQSAAALGHDATTAGTTIEIAQRVAAPRALGEVVREAPGAQVQSTGGLGSFAAMSLRGADASEALVLLDEIPLEGPDGGAFDLSAFPAELFDRIEVFRGGAPVWLGSGAIAGVLRLVPRRDPAATLDASVSAGSFGTWQLQAGSGVGRPDGMNVHTRAIVRGATNDFPFLDDGGTRFVTRDDRVVRRQNAQLTDASGLIDAAGRVLGGRLHAIVLANGRTAGEPGPGSQPTPNIRRTRARGLAGLAWSRSGRRADGRRSRLQLVAAGSYARDRYTDRFGELGTSRRWATRDDAYRGFVRGSAVLQLASWVEATLVGAYAVDHYDGNDRFTFPDPAPSTRHELAAAAELAARGKLGSIELELRPSARVAWSHTELHAMRTLSGELEGSRASAAPTARIGAGVAPLPGLWFTASLATGVRLPTMFELFGDRGLVLPAPELRPVTSTTYDAGVALRRRFGALSLVLDLHGFVQRRRDAIGAVRTAQLQVAHVNLSDVEQRGLEVGARLRGFEIFALHGALTYLRTEDASGKRLPLRPMWNLWVRPEARVHVGDRILTSAALAVELGYRSFVFADRANLAVIAPCTTASLSASLGFLHERLRLTGRLEDAADSRCTDILGYPLPGRSLLFTLTYQEREHAV